MALHKREFHANGKLLLSGEYVVLDGALALAVPAKKGQSMQVFEHSNEKSTSFEWKAYDYNGELWLQENFQLSDLKIESQSKSEASKMLTALLNVVHQAKPEIFDKLSKIETHLEFPNDWGFGSSSTLVSLLALWSGINAYELLAVTTGGSGYDIACAQATTPIFFQREKNGIYVKPVQLHKNILPHLTFVHLNRKQNSREAVIEYQQLPKSPTLIEEISNISLKMQLCDNVREFQILMQRHEWLLSTHINMPTVHSVLFPDLDVAAVKSLGAWGGDFVMVCSEKKLENYFSEKGYKTTLSAENFCF
ncbi:MAG: GYDIA family GHMP kinase [Weeksellaceae bacterium]|nr:GYDIA family GHMP kinase [Weeksellaceae bacterium]